MYTGLFFLFSFLNEFWIFQQEPGLVTMNALLQGLLTNALRHG